MKAWKKYTAVSGRRGERRGEESIHVTHIHTPQYELQCLHTPLLILTSMCVYSEKKKTKQSFSDALQPRFKQREKIHFAEGKKLGVTVLYKRYSAAQIQARSQGEFSFFTACIRTCEVCVTAGETAAPRSCR